MAVNTIGDFIRSVFSTMVNKNGTIFKALLADKENGDGTVEKIFTDLEETRKAWTDIKSVYDMTGEMFEKTMDLISVLTILPSDTEKIYLNRLRLLFYRDGHTLWGTRYDILNIFKKLLANENVYLVNNTDDKNLLANGNFEHKTDWILEDCSYEREARFEESTGILFNASGFLRQTVSGLSADTTYFLHFFVRGKIRVKITDNNGRCWNPNGGEVGSWADTEHYISFSSSDWDNRSVFFITDECATAITVEFAYVSGEYAFLDYVRLNEKDGTSTFSLIAAFEGVYSDKTAHFAPGENDQSVRPADYKKYGYYAGGDEDTEKKTDGSKSFFDNSPIKEGSSPVFQGGTKDTEPLDGYENMSYNNESKAFAPGDGDENIDYSKASYFDNTFIFGATGTAATEIYQELLDIVQPAGITGMVEILTRESDD